MFDRDTIRLPRVMDDEPIVLRISQIEMVCTNANENGPVEGTSAIYLRSGLAVAVNNTVDEVLEAIRAVETTQ